MNKREAQTEMKVFLTGPYKTARDFFEMLGVHKGSTKDELDAARNRIARLIHPDRWETDDRRKHDAAGAMATVNAAHTILTTRDKRLRYLAELAHGRSVCPTCKGEGYTKKQRGFHGKELIACHVCGGSGLYKERK